MGQWRGVQAREICKGRVMDQAVLTKKRILIADDEPSIRLLYERELTKEGYEVFFAANGQDALRLAREVRPDLVVLDIRMPGMDGIQALHRLLEEQNSLPVVINTAYSSYKDNFLCWAAEAYLVKSSELTELKDTIRFLLNRRN
jgi:DNA-binding response OmpR family regulator